MAQIIKDKYFSTTQLKTSTKDILNKTQDLGEIFIMNNNKPKVVIMSIEKYNDINKNSIAEVEASDYEVETIKNFKKEKKEWKIDFISSDILFNNLKNV